MNFTKMHGAGNDYVYVNCFDEPFPQDTALLARQVSDRHKGIGGDGLILICPTDQADAQMRMFNADGSESEMCGNGIRCVAKYVYDHGIAPKDHLKIETGAGILDLELDIENGKATRVRVDMGEPILDGLTIPTIWPEPQVVSNPLHVGSESFDVTCVSMGNPHCVIFVPAITDALVLGAAPQIETHDCFPSKVNVEFVEVLSPSKMRQRTWERGSGETQACGTGASAVCVAGVLEGRTERKVTIHLLGGDLELEWNEADNHVYMTGPATEVFSGVWTSTE